MRRLIVRASAFLALMIGAGLALAYSTGPPPQRTAAPAVGAVPAESHCGISCHTGAALNDPGGLLEILDVPEPYTPGQTYPLRIRLAYAHPKGVTEPRWGFEITAVSADGSTAGTFVLPDGAGSPGFEDSLLAIVGTGAFSARSYVTHSEFATHTAQMGPVEWQLDWTAPETDVGVVGFYAAGNAANGNFSFTGDRIFTASARANGPSLVAVAGAPALGVATLAGARPNPFATRAELPYTTPRAGHVSLVIYDLQGRKVRTLVSASRPAGPGHAAWDGADDGGARAPNGTYYARLQAPGVAPVQRTVTLAR